MISSRGRKSFAYKFSSIIYALALAVMLIPANAFGEMSQSSADTQASTTTVQDSASTSTATGDTSTNTAAPGDSASQTTDASSATTAQPGTDASQATATTTDTAIAPEATAVVPLSSDAITPQADNGIVVSWNSPSSWGGTVSGTAPNYTFTPSGNGNTAFQAQISISSSEAHAAGTLSFKLNKALLEYRDGSKCDTFSTGIPAYNAAGSYGDAYFYYKDNGDGTITVTNAKDIPSNDTKVFSMTWTVEDAKVKNGTTASVTPTAVTPDTVKSSGATVTFANDCTITNMNKEAVNNGTGVRSLPSASAPAPAGADYYFGHDAAYYTSGAGSFSSNYYMLYKLSSYTSGNEPNTLTFTDTLDATDAGKNATIVGMSIDSNGLTYVKPIGSATGTYTVGEIDKTNIATGTSTPQGNGWVTCYVLVQYPKAGYGTLNPGDSLTFINNASGSATGIDTKTTTTKDSAPCEAKWTKGVPQGGGGNGSDKGFSKTNNEGAAAVLYQNIDDNVATYDLHSQVWYADVQKDAEGKVTSVNIPKHNAYVIDDTMQVYNASLNNGAGGYKTLGPSDYYINSITLSDISENSFDADANAMVPKTTSDAHFDIYIATASTDGPYTLLASRTFDEVKNNTGGGRSITEMNGRTDVVAYYVEYVGSDYYSDFHVYSDVVLKGGSQTWNDYIPSGTSSCTLVNNAAFPQTYAADQGTNYPEDKLVASEAAKDFESDYQKNWGTTQASDQAARDASNWGKFNATGRTGAGIKRAWGDSLFNLTQLVGANKTWKADAGSTNDTTNQCVHMKYNQFGFERYNMTGSNLDYAVDTLKTTLERDSATFYDLLPAGETYEVNSATARGTYTDKDASVTAETMNNYRGTGRQMVIFHVTSTDNYYCPGGTGTSTRAEHGSSGGINWGGYLQSGFEVSYSCKVPWNSMSDVSAVPSDTAYQLTDNLQMLGDAYADQVNMGANNLPGNGITRSNVAPHDTVYVDNNKVDAVPAFNNLKNISNYDPTTMGTRVMDTIYNNLKTTVTADYEASSGLTKQVKPADGEAAWADSATVNTGADYQYRLSYSNTDYISVDNLVLYDNFEQANSGAEHWQGKFKSVDTSVAEAKGIKPVIYYSTTSNSSLDVTDGSWTTTEPSDPTLVKAVAVDLSWTDDARTQKYTLKNLDNVSASLTFTAPSSMLLADDLNAASVKSGGQAYNGCGASLEFFVQQGGTGTSTTVSDKDSFTKVKLFDPNATVPVIKVDDSGTPGAVEGATFKLEKPDPENSEGRITLATDITSATAAEIAAGKTTTGIVAGDLTLSNATYTGWANPNNYTWQNTGYTLASTILKTPLALPGGAYNSTNQTYDDAVYYLTETEAPQGYELNSTEYRITVKTAIDATTQLPTYTYKVEYKNAEGNYVEVEKDANDKTPIVDNKIDVSMAKKLTSTAIDANGNVTYEITLKNNKDTAVSNYVLSDKMTGLTYVSHTPTDGVTYDAAKGTFTVDKILAKNDDNYADVVITVTCKVTADKFENQAEPTTTPEAKSNKVRVDASGNPATDTVNVGDTVYYKLTVDNSTGTGSVDAGYKTTDSFTGLRYIGTDSTVTENADGSLTWTTADAIAAGGTKDIVLPFIVEPTITGEGDTVTTTIIDNSANGTAVGEKVANVTKNKELIYNDVLTDGTVTYKITLTNSGAVAAPSYTFADDMTGLTYISHTTDGANATYDSGKFTVDSIPADKGKNTVTITVKCKVTDAQFTNAVPPAGANDPSVSKVRVTDETGATNATDTPIPGQAIYYKLTVTNTAENAKDYAAGEYTLTDTFEGMTYTGTDKSITDNGDGTLTWTCPAIAAGKTIDIVVPFKITKTDAKGETTTLISNKASNTIVSEEIPNVSVVKDVVTPATEVGGTATYTLTLSNMGTAVAKDFKVADFMTNLTYVDSSVTTGDATVTWDGSNFTVSQVPLGKDSVVITVNCATTAATYANVAQTTGSTDPVLSKVRVDASGNPTTDTVYAGDTVYYKVTYDNSKGDLEVDAGKTFTDTFEGLTYVSATGDGQVAQTSSGLTWTAPEIAAGESASTIMSFTVNEGSTVLTNKVTADNGSGSAVANDAVGVISPESASTPKTNDYMMYVAIGLIALVAAGAVVLVVSRKKRRDAMK